MKLDNSGIEFSNVDKKKGIILPDSLTVELAEFIGVMIGDGHLSHRTYGNKRGNLITQSEVVIAGNTAEFDYLLYVMELFYSLFNVAPRYSKVPKSNSSALRHCSKAITSFLNKVCLIPTNKKSDIVRIPQLIKDANEEIQFAFLRGLCDTDFTVTFKKGPRKSHSYPLIKGTFNSKALIQDLEILLPKLGFKHSTYYDELRPDKRWKASIMHSIFLYGYSNINRWINNVGFSNSKFTRKIEKWQTDGVCPPGY